MDRDPVAAIPFLQHGSDPRPACPFRDFRCKDSDRDCTLPADCRRRHLRSWTRVWPKCSSSPVTNIRLPTLRPSHGSTSLGSANSRWNTTKTSLFGAHVFRHDRRCRKALQSQSRQRGREARRGFNTIKSRHIQSNRRYSVLGAFHVLTGRRPSRGGSNRRTPEDPPPSQTPPCAITQRVPQQECDQVPDFEPDLAHAHYGLLVFAQEWVIRGSNKRVASQQLQIFIPCRVVPRVRRLSTSSTYRAPR